MPQFITTIFLSLIICLPLSSSYALDNKNELLFKTTLLAKTGHYKEAIVELDKIIAIDSKDPKIYMMRAFSYTKEGLLDLAIVDYNTIIEMEPGNGNAYYNRGFSFMLKKDYAQSWKDINKAKSMGIAIDPKFLNDLKKNSGRDK